MPDLLRLRLPPATTLEYPSEAHPSCSEAWFCIHCGDIYARIVTLRNDQYGYQTKHGCCSACPPRYYQLPGGVYFGRDIPAYLDHPAVLIYLLETELRFLGSPYYPRKDQSDV